MTARWDRRFQALVQNSSEVVTVVRADGTIVFQTASVTRILGYGGEELAGTRLVDLTHPDDCTGLWTTVIGTAPGDRTTAVVRLRRADGEWRRCETTTTNLLADPAVNGYVLNSRDITDIEAAQAALRQREEQLHEAQLLARLGSWETDLTTGRVTASRALYDITGLEPEAGAVNLDAYRAGVHHDDLAVFDAAYRKALDTGEPGSFEFRFHRPDGSTIWLQARFEVVVDSRGIPVLLRGTSQDVTERREADDQIRFQSRLLDAVGQAVIAIDADRQVTYWNPAAERLFGWKAEEVMGRVIRELAVAPEDMEKAAEIVALLRSGQPWSGEFPLQRRDGTRFSALVTDAPVFDHSGELAGMIGVLSDLTERKASEDALRHSEERLRGVLEASPLTIIEFDRHGVVQFWNAAAEAMYGWTRTEVEGRPPPFTTADGGGAFDAVFRRVLAGERIDNQEFVRRSKDGSPLHVSVSMAPLYDEHGRIVGVTSAGLDITRQRHLEAELRQAQKMEAIGRLAGGIAHDFNNILTVVIGYVEMMLHRLDPQTEMAAWGRTVDDAARRAAELTDQLLTFSRRQVVAGSGGDLGGAVTETCPMLKRLIGEDVELSVDVAVEGLPVAADRSQLQQILLNLAVNARDAMPSGGKLDIAATAGELAGVPAAVLHVNDSGSGMDEATRAHIFEPFFTTKPDGKGTGLGLSTVYGIVAQHDGVIEVASAPGDGTRFTVTLPLTVSAPAITAPTTTPAGLTAKAGVVLLVEDEATVRALAREALELKGHTVLEARDGEHALEVAARHEAHIDVLLTDVVLPRLPGPELAARLTSERPRLRVVFMSGYAEHSLEHMAGRYARFLAKPFRPAELAAAVAEATASGPPLA